MTNPIQNSFFWTTSSSGDGSASSYTRDDLTTILKVVGSVSGSEGVGDYGNKYVATTEAATVIIGTGGALVDGKPHVCTTAGSVAIVAASGGGNTRIDRIVLRADWTAGGASPQTVRIVRIPGTSAASPAAPSLTQTSGSTYDLPLWQALVDTAGTVTVTDERCIIGPVKKNDFTKTAAPAVTDDVNDGYSVGSVWVDVTNDQFHMCVDSTAGAAVWHNVTSTLRASDGSPVALTVGATGAVTAAIAPLTLTGGQLAFPATQNASADANTLDDYEEGTWTPTLTFGGSSSGMSTTGSAGYYTKLGNIVTISGYLVMPTKGSSTGDAVMGGLPFTISNNVAAYAAVAVRLNTVSFANFPQATGTINDTTIQVGEITEAGVITSLVDTNFENGSSIMMNMTYRAA